jgi:hypothetical protein
MLMEINKYYCSNLFLCQKLKFRATFAQLKLTLDISLSFSVTPAALNTV